MDEKIVFSDSPKEGKPWDVVIIGSGPAGFTAAIYTTRGAASTLIIAGDIWGGQLMLTTTVDNFPGFPEGIAGPDLMSNMRKQTERFGAEILERKAEAIDFEKKPFEIAAGGKVFKASSVIIATGSDTRWLGVPGEKELIGKGVSSCAPCDAPFFKDKKVAVVGGGDSAMEEALVLTKYASNVTLIHRRDEFKASAAMQKRVFDNKKIKVIWNSEVKEFLGDQKLEKIKLFNNKENNEQEEQFDGVFVAIGHIPATEIFSGKIETDEKGYVIKKGPQTDIKNGVFVAGDVHDHIYAQAITAAGFGCMAGMDALRYLDKRVPSW
jgi:thioredoxin reductase (NADPH)